MKTASEVKKIVSNLKPNVIYDYSLFDNFENRNALYVAIKRLIDDGIIRKTTKGKFVKVDKKDSKIDLKEDLLKDGIEIEQSLYFKLGLSSIKALTIKVLSPNVKGYYKTKCKLLNEEIVYKPYRFKDKFTKTNKTILELFEVLQKKDEIEGLIFEKYVEYVKSTCKSLEKDHIKDMKKILSNFRLKTQIIILTNLEKIDYTLAKELSSCLKTYQKPSYVNSIKESIESRIFILLNRNISSKFKYNKDEINEVFSTKEYSSLNSRGKSIFAKIFKEFDSFDFDLLKRDFYINIEYFKNIFLGSPYRNDKYIYNTWESCLHLDRYKENKKNLTIRKSSRIDEILKRREN